MCKKNCKKRLAKWEGKYRVIDLSLEKEWMIFEKVLKKSF